MNVFWDVRSASEHPGLLRGEAPQDLLCEAEQAVLAGLKLPKRRQEWLLGRYTAKILCRAWLAQRGVEATPASIEIVAGEDGAPRAFLPGQGALPLTISISHSSGLALCALVEGREAPLGADLERCEPRSLHFVQDFFTEHERRLLAEIHDDDGRAATGLWSLKESTLKALRLGLRADTRRVDTRPAPGGEGWRPTEVSIELEGAPRSAAACLRDHGPFVLTLAWLGGGELVPSDEFNGWAGLERALPGGAVA